MNQSSRSSPHYFSDLASQCLGSLDRLQLILPGDEEIESMLLEVLTMHAHHALKHQNASMARAHVNRLKDMTGMDQDDLERMQLELHALSQQYASTQDELATRIQYTLMEKIATLTKERDELRQALQDATDEHP